MQGIPAGDGGKSGMRGQGVPVVCYGSSMNLLCFCGSLALVYSWWM